MGCLSGSAGAREVFLGPRVPHNGGFGILDEEFMGSLALFLLPFLHGFRKK
jgi:hypothetical protein